MATLQITALPPCHSMSFQLEKSAFCYGTTTGSWVVVVVSLSRWIFTSSSQPTVAPASPSIAITIKTDRIFFNILFLLFEFICLCVIARGQSRRAWRRFDFNLNGLELWADQRIFLIETRYSFQTGLRLSSTVTSAVPSG